MSDTSAYYDRNAARFVANTVDVDMTELHARFLEFVPDGGLILDAGCGSGRDSKAFLERGYRVRAFDASAEVARLATGVIGQPAETLTFDDLTDVACYDGVWACASLLHLTESAIPAAIARPSRAIAPSGEETEPPPYHPHSGRSAGRAEHHPARGLPPRPRRARHLRCVTCRRAQRAAAQLFSLFGLANLVMARQRLLDLDTQGES